MIDLFLQQFSIICPVHQTASAVPSAPPIVIHKSRGAAPARNMRSITKLASCASTRTDWEPSASPTMVVLWIIPFAQIASVCVETTISRRTMPVWQVGSTIVVSHFICNLKTIICLIGIGADCSQDEECGADNTVCLEGSNSTSVKDSDQTRSCQCRKGYVHFKDECLKEGECAFPSI